LDAAAGSRARWAGHGDRARHLASLDITPRLRAARFGEAGSARAARYGGQAGEAGVARGTRLRAARYGGQASHVAPGTSPVARGTSHVARSTWHVAPASALRATARQA
jgi:hypothetical protein